jgi:hypothetical protein
MDTSSDEDEEVWPRQSVYPLVSQVQQTSTPSSAMQLYIATSTSPPPLPYQTPTKFQPETAMVVYQYNTPPTETAMLSMETDVGRIKRDTPEKMTVRRSIRNATKAKLKLNKTSPETKTSAAKSPAKKSPAHRKHNDKNDDKRPSRTGDASD